MEVLGQVFLQVVAFATGLLVLAWIGVGIYMRLSGRDPFTDRPMPQPRSTLQWLFSLFFSLMLFAIFVGWLVPKELVTLRTVVAAAVVLFMATGLFFFVKFLRRSPR